MRAPRAAALACALASLAALLLGGAWALNDAVRGDRVETEAARAAREMAGRVGALDTLMAALAGLRAGGDGDDDGGALIVLASRLREQVPFVTSLGRYRRVGPEQRAAFVESMAERGLYDFRIRHVRRAGESADAGTDPGGGGADVAYPISMLEPMTPANVALLGGDLAAVDGLAERLEASAARDGSILAELPDGWPGRGRLMLFHPAYLGTHVPTDAGLRREQSDGGHWAMIDAAALLGDSAPDFDVTLTIGGAGGTRAVHRRPARADDPLVLGALYAPAARHERWRIGDDWLEVSMTPRPGIAPGHLGAVALLVALATCAVGSVLLTRLERRRHLEGRARHREALYRARERSARTLEAISDAVVALDHDALVRHLNPAAERLLGGRAAGAPGARLDALLPLLDERGRPFDATRAIEALSRRPSVELDLRPAGGPPNAVFRATLTRTVVAADGLAEHIVVLRDVSDARRLHRELEHQANHDALTGCTNRLHFERRLAELVADRGASGRSHALLYLDLDQFKIVNDTCGHAAGDRLLVELTTRLRRLVRRADVLSRLGGDEFGLIIVDAAPEEARRVAEGVHRAFRSMTFTHDTNVFSIRASLGLVHFDEDDSSAVSLMAAADMACYAAKENGRDELVVHGDERERMAMRSTELNWLPRLQRALDEDAFSLHLQPIATIGADAPGGRIERFEFLLRHTDEEGREVAPWQIVRAAERYGLMRRLDRWIVTRALETVSRHASSLPPGTGFSINLSGQSVADPGLIDFIVASYERFGIEPATVGFEVTETATISSFETAVELLERIRALGSHVSLDDFGSGLSSFGYLKHLPVDVLKIDGQFVREIARSEVDRTMVRSMAEIARSMRIRTVAEFVEDQAILDVLVELGIDGAQGYHIARPMPVEQALALLEAPAEAPATAWPRAA